MLFFTVKDIYEEELHYENVFDYPLLLEERFERQPYVRVALAGQLQGYTYILDDKMICI